MKRNVPPPLVHRDVKLHHKEDVKYLGLHLDRRLTWPKKHFHKMESTRNHPHQNVPVTRTQVKTVHKQQTSHIQNNTETNPDLWNTTLGYGFHIQHRNPRTVATEILQTVALSMIHLGLCWIQLSEGISNHQQLKKKSVATALNSVLASAHTQTAS
jgi:hypothetical protein